MGRSRERNPSEDSLTATKMKDIVIEQDLNPEVDKPSKRKQLDVGRAGSQERDAVQAMDWDTESTPLVPCGGAPKFFGGEDKHNCNEGETIFVTFKIEADPVPGPDQIEWIKGGAKDMPFSHGASSSLTDQTTPSPWVSRSARLRMKGIFSAL
eukprot:TRINITY_DN6238_c0_g1_i1.p1 TRINITY_DN6238_c0_g1~~TRINITY_DN6238_c0_g1_i1.p1  ORF type:complete len:172 (-),score=40.32 TRINITY_DN6238_c0_g1_i1:134-592(-)